MATTTTTKTPSVRSSAQAQRVVQTSAAATAQTCSTATGQIRWVRQITVAYSAAPTHAGVTVTLNSGAGASFDTLLASGAANGRYFFFLPEKPILLMPDDTIDVLCPSGGGILTSSAAIYCLAQGAI